MTLLGFWRSRSIWSTGQDQCATIKRQLSMLLPGVSIFLDVDGCRWNCCQTSPVLT